MPAKHAMFEHFVNTGEMIVTLLEPEPYYTYEVGIDEKVHPDENLAMRFVEVAMSRCECGCKIYADPYSAVRVLVHSRVYGCRKTHDMLTDPKENADS